MNSSTILDSEEQQYKIIHSPKALDFNDVLIKPSGPSEHTTRKIPYGLMCHFPSSAWNRDIDLGIPIIAANMYHIGTLKMAQALGEHECNTATHKSLDPDSLHSFITSLDSFRLHRLWLTAGMDNESLLLLEQNIRVLKPHLQSKIKICLDVANGYQQKFLELVSEIRTKYPEAIIMAGNIATPEIIPLLIQHGTDICKVGIGSGSLCLTRYMTGVGVPQLTAIMECSEAAHQYGGLVCADGGCTSPGDIVKALVAGADLVMIGGMFGGFAENAGSIINTADGPKRQIYGMSSKEAMQELHGEVPSYRAPEGKSTLVPLRGPVAPFLESYILGGLRGAMTLTNSHSILDLKENAQFVRVRRQLNNVFGTYVSD